MILVLLHTTENGTNWLKLKFINTAVTTDSNTIATTGVLPLSVIANTRGTMGSGTSSGTPPAMAHNARVDETRVACRQRATRAGQRSSTANGLTTLPSSRTW